MGSGRGTVGRVYDEPSDIRHQFTTHLEAIDRLVRKQFDLVLEGIAGATSVLLADDRQAAERLVAGDAAIDDLEREIEVTVEQQMLLEAPVAADFRYLMTVTRIVPELERSGDLAGHIAAETARGFGQHLTPPLRGAVQDMGDLCVVMWRRAFDAFAEHDPGAADELDRIDDDLDRLHRRFVDEATEQVPAEWVVAATLVGRFYERLGDHAVNVSRRIRYLAIGRRES